MLVEGVQRLRRAVPADVLRGREGVHLHSEQRPTNEIGLLRLAGPDGNVGRAHGNGDLVVVEHQLDANVWIHLHEFAQALGDPDRAETDRRGDPEIARRLGGGVGQQRLGRRELVHDLAGGAKQHLALLGQNQTTRVPMEEGDLELLLQRGDLPADRRLAHAQRLTSMGEAAGLGGGMKDAEFVPVHGRDFRVTDRT